MACPALELAGRWVELGLSVETESLGELSLIDIMWGREVSGGLLDSALPPWRLMPDTRLKHQDPASHTAQKKRKKKKIKKIDSKIKK